MVLTISCLHLALCHSFLIVLIFSLFQLSFLGQEGGVNLKVVPYLRLKLQNKNHGTIINVTYDHTIYILRPKGRTYIWHMGFT